MLASETYTWPEASVWIAFWFCVASLFWASRSTNTTTTYSFPGREKTQTTEAKGIGRKNK
jgi:hypothetical protein